MTWTTPLGPGGAEALPWPVVPAADEGSLTFSRLIGVILPPGSHEIFFVGVQEPGRPPLDPDDLMDAFAVSLRAQPDAPGVSIDPTPAQLTHGLREGDRMTVRYIGGNAGTVVGAAAFEADRLMKCLSFGKDNVSRQSVTCGVPGYRSELELALDEPGSRKEEWHRFWIEQLQNPVGVSTSGNTVFLDARLGVRTEYMVAERGGLKSGNRPPSAPARRFAEHLTGSYDAYALEFAVYQELLAFGQMTALAEALTSESTPPALAAAVSGLDIDHLADGFPVRQVDTPRATPAIVVSRSADSPTSGGILRRTVLLTGGVDLTPRPRYQPSDARANRTERDVLDAVGRRPARTSWAVRSGDRAMVVTRRPMRRTIPSHWQTDMTVGPVEVVREWRPGDGQARIDSNWQIRVPSLELSADVVDLDRSGRMPRRVSVTLPSGLRAPLGRHASLQMPGQAEVPGYVNERGRRRRLYLFRNRFIFEDGDIRYVATDGGPPRHEIPRGSMVIEFSPTAPYRAERVISAMGTVELHWDGTRLARLSADSGEHVIFAYDRDGRLSDLRGSDGQLVEYRRDRSGALRALVNNGGDSMAYRPSERGGPPASVSAAFKDLSGASVAMTSLELSPVLAPRALQEATGALSDPHMVFVGITEAPAGSGREVDVFVEGRPISAAGRPERLIEAVIQEGGRGQKSNTMRDLFHEAGLGGRTIVVVGELEARRALAAALHGLYPASSIVTAANPTLAVKNLQAAQHVRGGYDYVHVADGLPDHINAGLRAQEQRRGSGDVVVVSGHNSEPFTTRLRQLADSGALKGKSVVLITCGGRESSVPDALLREAGAVEVLYLTQPVNARVVEPILSALLPRLEQLGTRSTTAIERAFRGALEEVQKGPLAPLLTRDDVRGLRLWTRQVGNRLHDTGRTTQTPSCKSFERRQDGANGCDVKMIA